MMIEASGSQVGPRCESKQTAVAFKLVYEEGVDGPSRIQRQSTVENGRTRMGGQVRGRAWRGQPQTSCYSRADRAAQTRHRGVAWQVRQPVRTIQNCALVVP